MNHLEQLVAEWLQYKGYFVRVSVLVEKRTTQGGHDGELDVVGFNPASNHLLHVECSLDAESWEKRREKFAKKFARPSGYLDGIFKGLKLPEKPDQIVLLLFGPSGTRDIGGPRVISGRQFIQEIFHGLKETSPESGAVSQSLPLLRTLQLVPYAENTVFIPEHALVCS